MLSSVREPRTPYFLLIHGCVMTKWLPCVTYCWLYEIIQSACSEAPVWNHTLRGVASGVNVLKREARCEQLSSRPAHTFVPMLRL
jgi:hypothetical protein